MYVRNVEFKAEVNSEEESHNCHEHINVKKEYSWRLNYVTLQPPPIILKTKTAIFLNTDTSSTFPALMKVTSGEKVRGKHAQRLKNAYFDMDKESKIVSVLLTSIVPYRNASDSP